ncbi:unnamed protein product [Orchesella dallaii]|uniref:Ionotropic glutamate receptor C-terminal domain-containing protein n=1 Tax=Orchesella dallaii TaxID=48710 RepID=A0ABP1RNZ7_9HEXA
MPKTSDMYCDEFGLKLTPNQGFKFQATPDPKATCLVQVYIDPVPCKKWSFGNVQSFLEMGSKSIFSGTFLDSILYYNKNINLDNIAKPGLVFLHVTKLRELDPYSDEVLFKVDNHWQSSTYYHVYNFIQPTKILLQIEPVVSKTGETINEIKESRLLSCQDYKNWWDRGVEFCKHLSQSPINNLLYGGRCFMSALQETAKLPLLLDYKKYNPKTWTDLESLRFNSDPCKNGQFVLVSPYASQVQNLDHFYIRDLVEYRKRKDEPGILKHEQLVESLTWGLLRPNSTLIGNTQQNSAKMLTFLYFPFIYPKITTIVHLESIGYIGPLEQVHFVTCAPVKKSSWISLIGLVAAFEWRLWLVIGIASTVCGLTVYLMLQFSQIYITQKKIGTSVTVIGFVWDVLLGQGNSAVDKVRWIGGTWALVGVVLTNAYLGDNINMLTAPLPMKKVETFDELFQSNFSIYSTFPDNYHIGTFASVFSQLGPIGDLLFGFQNEFNGLKKRRVSIFGILFSLRNLHLSSEEAMKKAFAIENISNVTFEASNADIVTAGSPAHYASIIGKCGMDAYVDTRANLDRVYHKLEQKFRFNPELSKQLTMSKDTYGEVCKSWHFGNIPWPATMFLKKVHGLLESGLSGIWTGWIHWVENLEDEMRNAREKQNDYVPVTLYGNVRALFFFYLGIVLFPLVVFAFETRKKFGLLLAKGTNVSVVENKNNAQKPDGFISNIMRRFGCKGLCLQKI